MALKSPAYKYDDCAALFKAVRDTVRARASRVEPPKLTLVEKPTPRKRSAPSPIVVADLIKDAYAHEKRQPADTYDAEAEEEARKPI